ncbi:MAG: SDR family NAD(P)-dependent oxidoreductase [Oligoflexia bacterium]|nr:SDR family NAD(P)-dependent oxidoreductase [Oligoflexia bacterium]
MNRSNTGISCLFSTGLAAFSTSQIPSGRGPFLKHDFRDRSPNGHAINRWVWSCGEAFTTLPKDGADRPVEMLGDVRNHNFNGFLIDFRFCQMPDISFLKEDFSELIEFSRDIRRRLAKGSLQRLYVFLHAPQSLQPNLSNSPIIEAVRSLLLTISREYPDFKLHIILTPNPVTSNQALQAVQRLIMIHELPVECILFANKLYRRVLIPAPVTPIGATIDFDGDASNEGYLITGGAGGITAEIGIQTALKKGGRFLLVGRSSLPEAIDRRDRQQFFSEVRHQYANLKPVEYQRLWEKHSRSQATFKNIQRYRAVGAKVTYVQADLSTNEGLNKLSTAISSFGKIDHLIHGAGVERSKRFLEKGQEEFESILALKSLVTQRLLRLLPSDIKSLTLFGSVASITGSVGQSDYSAANAIHFAAASRLHQDFPRARIKSIAWPAWDEVGMAVNESVHGAMKDKGLSFLSVQDGCDFFSRELLLNTDAVVATLPGDRATADPFWYRATLFGIGERLGPVIDRIVLHTADELITEKLFTGQESVLKDHIIRGFPTLPGVTLTEMVLESAQLLQKDPSRIIIEEIVFDSPAVVSRPTSFRVRLKQNGDYWIVRLTSTKTRSDGYLLDPEYLHAHARVSLNGLIHARPTKKELPRKSLRGKREFYELLYSVFPEKLGITYQNLDKVVFKNDSQVMGLAQLSEECDFVGPGAITNGAIFDLMNQIMAEFATRPESTYIPKSFKKVRSFAPFVSGSTYWVENSNVSISSSELTYETHFWDESGDLILHVQEVNQAHYQRRKVEHA